jgi:hypothetical protein
MIANSFEVRYLGRSPKTRLSVVALVRPGFVSMALSLAGDEGEAGPLGCSWVAAGMLLASWANADRKKPAKIASTNTIRLKRNMV